MVWSCYSSDRQKKNGANAIAVKDISADGIHHHLIIATSAVMAPPPSPYCTSNISRRGFVDIGVSDIHLNLKYFVVFFGPEKNEDNRSCRLYQSHLLGGSYIPVKLLRLVISAYRLDLI